MPLEIQTLVDNWAITATSISAILGAVIYIWKKGLSPVIRVIKKWNTTIDKIDKIFEEISPNNGSSIKDTVNSINRGLVEVSEMQKAILADDDKAHFKTDAQGNYIWVNRTYSRTVERMPSELMGHGWQNAIAQNERDYVVNSWYDAVKESREFAAKINLETPTGNKIPARVRSYKMTDGDGDIIGFMGTIILDD